MPIDYTALCERILSDPAHAATPEEAKALFALPPGATLPLLACAQRIRELHSPPEFTCGIINARSGRCRENCAFCAQSAHHNCNTPIYDMLDVATVVEHAKRLAAFGANRFGIVISGTRPGRRELDMVCEAVQRITEETSLSLCASLGLLSAESAQILYQAGLERYHHNLETARSFFPDICTTHAYSQAVDTIKLARKAGLRLCCGGIFGLGESYAQRTELATDIKELEADSIPINFLTPIPGTPLEKQPLLPPFEALRSIAVFRFMHPTQDILVAGGRESTLGEYRSWTFMSGANGLMVGNYLTTSGQALHRDYTMLHTMGII